MTYPPFGTFPLNAREEFARKWGAKLRNDPLSKLARSALKHIAAIHQQRPRDVTVFETEYARLYPYDNICEKRVFLTPHLWEIEERTVLKTHIQSHQQAEFYFVDAGANVGLYTLFARHCSKKSGHIFKSICIEPGRFTAKRLKQNLELSNFEEDEAIVYKSALSDKTGLVSFNVDTNNLGESRLQASDTKMAKHANQISAEPLLDIVLRSKFPRIDALKIDIEGQEWPVLNAFLNNADQALIPSIIIMEIAHTPNSQKLLSLCKSKNYQTVNQSRGNIVLSRV